MFITDQVVVNAINHILHKKIMQERQKVNDFLKGTVRIVCSARFAFRRLHWLFRLSLTWCMDRGLQNKLCLNSEAIWKCTFLRLRKRLCDSLKKHEPLSTHKPTR